MNLFSPTVLGLGRALELYAARHQVLTENLAHAETPGYRAKEMDFGDALRSAFESREIDGSDASLPPRIESRREPVDLDREMAILSENSLRVLALSRIVARKYSGLKTLIGELGR